MTRKFFACIALMAGSLVLTGCVVPRSGPLAKEVRQSGRDGELTILPISEAVVADTLRPPQAGLPEGFMFQPAFEMGQLAPGDRLAITVMESAGNGQFPAALNGPLKLEIQVSSVGTIVVPYAGKISAAGRQADDVRAMITRRLARKLYKPQVVLQIVEQLGQTVTVHGAVTKGGVFPIGAGMSRLSDLIALAGPDAEDVDRMVIEVRRTDIVGRVPLLRLLADQSQDIPLMPGDVVTVLRQQANVTVIGAAGLQGRIAIKGESFSLIDALASARGLDDMVADPSGVYLIRRHVLADGQPPEIVAYELDMRNPRQLALAEAMEVTDGDVILVATGSFAQTRKVLTSISSSLSVVTRAAITR